MNVSDWPWIKILGTLCGVLIAFVEILEYRRRRKNRKWLKRKKVILLSLIAALLCFSLWDNVNEESKSIAQEKARDTLIIKDSVRIDNLFKRTDTILNSVGTAVMGIEDSKSKLKVLDSLAVATNNRLALAIEKSKELLELEYTKLEITAPDVRILNSTIAIVKDSVLGHNIYFEMHNYGGRLAEKISYKCMLIASNDDGSRTNVYLSPRGSIWNQGNPLPANDQIMNRTTAKFNFNKKEVLEYGTLYFLARMRFKDKSLNVDYDFNVIFVARNIHLGDEQFYFATPSEERQIRNILGKYNLVEYLSESGID